MGQRKILVVEACDRFYADCVAQRLSNSSLRKYNLLVADKASVWRSLLIERPFRFQNGFTLDFA